MNPETIALTTKKYSLDEAFAYCELVTTSHYENFPVASLFLPQEKRPFIQSIYAFSRIADDYADELDRKPQERLDALDAWEEKLQLCSEGVADHPVFIALSETLKRLALPIQPLRDLLSAFRLDVTQNRFETFEDVLAYCRCSANPVGRLVLMIFGYRDEQFLALSDHICTALQLTNFWQDVAVDRDKDRLYIPMEDLMRFGYSIEDWKKGIVDDKFRSMLKFEIDRTKELFYQGAELPSLVERDLQIELKLVWLGGMTVLKLIDKRGYDVFYRRPTLATSHKLMILLRGLFMTNLRRYGRKRDAWDQT